LNVKGRLENFLKLFKTPEGVEVRRIRASTLASYFWCSPRAWMMALGVETPPSQALELGSKIHADIEKARKQSPYEEEFKAILDQFFAEGTIARPWLDMKTEIVTGEIRTHGIDDFKVTSDRLVDLIEYKSKAGWRIQPVSLMPAIFQTKIYCWILEPFLLMKGYRWREIWIVFVKRERSGKFKPIGEHQVEDYSSIKIEKKIAEIFDEWNNASEAKTNKERRAILIPPKKWKCLHCPDVYRLGKNPLGLRCPFS